MRYKFNRGYLLSCSIVMFVQSPHPSPLFNGDVSNSSQTHVNMLSLEIRFNLMDGIK